MNVGCSIDAEWIMEKKHWRQSVRQERAAALTPARSGGTGSSGDPSNIPGSSPTGNHGIDTDDANAYPPEMDEMRCLLWAHGGSFHVAFLLPFYVNFKVGIISGAWIRRGEEHYRESTRGLNPRCS